MSIIYSAEYVLTMESDGSPKPGQVWVEDGLIREVGQAISKKHPHLPLIDLGEAALLPGFVNAHSHVEYTMSRGHHDSLNLWEWLNRVGFRRGRVPDADLIAASARLGVAECAHSGITCLGDCSFSGIAASAIDESGLRGIVYKELFGQSMGLDYERQFANVLVEAQRLQQSTSDRITIGLSPHTVYTSSIEVLELCAKTCTHLDMPMAMHLAETCAEQEYTRSGTGPIADWRRQLGYEVNPSGLTPLEVMRSAGVLCENVALAHCVHLSDDEIEMISQSGAGVIHCPRSNAYLGAGIFSYNKFKQNDANVGLGTDSAASCLRLDFFEEMRFAAALHRAASQDAAAISAKQVLELATVGGAKSLGLSEKIGCLKPGMRADMIAVDLSESLPGEDIYLSIISKSPDNIKLRLVDGKPIFPRVERSNNDLKRLMERGELEKQ